MTATKRAPDATPVRRSGRGWQIRGDLDGLFTPRGDRSRRPNDVLVLLFAIIVLVVLAMAAPKPTNLDRALADLVDALPGLLTGVWRAAHLAAALWAAVLCVIAATRRRYAILRDLLVALGLAFCGTSLLTRVTE